jgi:hypothetical protein
MLSKRLCIYPKDVQRITGKSERFGRLLLQRIKNANGKEKHHFVSLEEFCKFTGLQTNEVEKYLND